MMDKLKLNLYSVLTTVGFKETAQDVLVSEFKKNIPSLQELETATENLKAVKSTYKALEGSQRAELEKLQADIQQLEQSVFEVDVTKPRAVEEMIKINSQIAMKKDRISAVQAVIVALGAKGKAEQLDVLAEGFKAIKKVATEAGMLEQTIKPVINAMNKTAIVNALAEIDAEIEDRIRVFSDTATALGVSQQIHNGVHLYHPYFSTYMAVRVAE
jgi:chromosome segregation ATPase